MDFPNLGKKAKLCTPHDSLTNHIIIINKETQQGDYGNL